MMSQKFFMLKPLYFALSLTFCITAFADEVVPEKIKFTVKKFTVEGEPLAAILDNTELEAYLKPFQEKSFDLKELQDVSKGLETLIRDEGFAFYRVILPPQSLNSGEVKLKVIAFNVGEIDVVGNDSFSKENVLSSLPELKKDISPNTQELSASTKVANQHPSKQVVITFKQDESEDKINATVDVSEQRPYQFSLQFNNTGNDMTGDYRLTGAAQYSNLWGLDHIVNASYTLPPDHADTVKQYGGSYALPIYPLRGWLNMYYAYSSSNNGIVSGTAISGAGEMIGIHYQQFLPKFEKYEHSLDIGFDSRYFINSIEANKEKQAGDGNVRSLPFSISYRAEYPFEDVRTGYFIQWVKNTGWGSENSDTFYNKLTTGADSSWQLFRYGSNFETTFDDWLFTTSLTGQYSEKPLIQGERLGIGGNYDVRGYEQRETSADNGQIVKLELTTPAWEKINAFVFYDYGHGELMNPQVGELKEWNLSSTGVGAKWKWQEYIGASLTFATALNNSSDSTKAFNNRLLLNVNVSY